MVSKRMDKRHSMADVLFFGFLFIVCAVGTIGFMWFVLGIENGNVVMKNALKALVDNALGIVIVLLVCNGFLAYFYSRKR